MATTKLDKRQINTGGYVEIARAKLTSSANSLSVSWDGDYQYLRYIVSGVTVPIATQNPVRIKLYKPENVVPMKGYWVGAESTTPLSGADNLDGLACLVNTGNNKFGGIVDITRADLGWIEPIVHAHVGGSKGIRMYTALPQGADYNYVQVIRDSGALIDTCEIIVMGKN